MNIVYAQEDYEVTSQSSIFLAGPSPRGKSEYNWRPEAIEILKERGFSGDVFVPLPRDGEYTGDFDYDSQIDWELKYLNLAKVIVFWIPRDVQNLPGFTTNVEFGMFLKSGKIILGYPEGAPKMRYLHYVAEKNNVQVFNNLNETILSALIHKNNK